MVNKTDIHTYKSREFKEHNKNKKLKTVSVYDILIRTFEKSKHLSCMLFFVFRGPLLLPSLCIRHPLSVILVNMSYLDSLP